MCAGCILDSVGASPSLLPLPNLVAFVQLVALLIYKACQWTSGVHCQCVCVCCTQDWVRRKHKNIPIEVETRTLEEVKEVLQFLESDKHSLVKRLMLDNMTKLDSSAPGRHCWSYLHGTNAIFVSLVPLMLSYACAFCLGRQTVALLRCSLPGSLHCMLVASALLCCASPHARHLLKFDVAETESIWLMLLPGPSCSCNLRPTG